MGVEHSRYPVDKVVFAEKVDRVDVVYAEHVNALQNEVQGIQNFLGVQADFPVIPRGNNDTVAGKMHGVLDIVNAALADAQEAKSLAYELMRNLERDYYKKTEVYNKDPEMSFIIAVLRNEMNDLVRGAEKKLEGIKGRNTYAEMHDAGVRPTGAFTGSNRHDAGATWIAKWTMSNTWRFLWAAGVRAYFVTADNKSHYSEAGGYVGGRTGEMLGPLFPGLSMLEYDYDPDTGEMVAFFERKPKGWGVSAPEPYKFRCLMVKEGLD